MAKRTRKPRVVKPTVVEPVVAEEAPEPTEEALPPDLQAPVDATTKTPQLRAQMVRRAFGARGWPNAEHPGTVRDFMQEHDIPCL